MCTTKSAREHDRFRSTLIEFRHLLQKLNLDGTWRLYREPSAGYRGIDLIGEVAQLALPHPGADDHPWLIELKKLKRFEMT